LEGWWEVQTVRKVGGKLLYTQLTFSPLSALAADGLVLPPSWDGRIII